MSIKDLFNKKNSVDNVVVAENATASAEYIESFETVRAKRKLNDKLIPRIDFATASNFAKFGSAELYYQYGFERIYNEYPYDGTEEEKLNFRLSSSYLDDYIFENHYPRVNGYVQFGVHGTATTSISSDGYGKTSTPEYILIKGGPHTASGGMIGSTIASKFEDSNYYDASNDLGSSLELKISQGITVEFWMKKDSFTPSDTEREVIFDLYNDGTAGSTYGRLTLAMTASGPADDGENPFIVTFISGSDTTGIDNRQIPISNFTTASIADGNWHHYAFTFLSKSSGGIDTKVYIDGIKKITDSSYVGSFGDIQTLSGNVATIGGLIAQPYSQTPSNYVTGSGKLNAYIDEFRYWKYARTDKQIANSFFIPLAGGNNENKYNRKLGVYYKFNEGITGTDSVDSVVLDYSGRLANGEWYNYTSSARSTNSAMVESGYARSEFKDPIIYSFHPDVVSTLATLKTTGSLQDKDGTSKLIGMMPGWLQEKDIDVYNNQVKKFLQILGSYFDDLHGQVTEFGKIKDIHYPTATEEPYPFADRLVEDRGLVVPQLFLDGDIVNYLLQKDDNEIFEQNISDLKNRIYHNIYNNLDYILKSKGTEKSFRNLIRCFGIDTEVLRLSLYADDSTYTIQENYENTSIEKKFLNLNNKNNFEGTIYNVSSSDSNFTYISSSEGSQEENTALTFQCETIFPLKLEKRDGGYFRTDFLTSSIAGFHRALTSSATDYTWHDEDTDIQIYSVRHETEGKDGYFVLTSSLGFEITSSTYFSLYDNNKWNFAFRVRNNKYPYTYGLSGSTGDDYFVEFVGYNSIGNYVSNYFSLSSSVSNEIGKKLLCNSKRLYAGAHRTNFTGSTLIKSDVLVSDVKYWQSYLDDETIKLHSFNPDNAGTKTPFRPDNVNTGIENHELTDFETMALHWRLDTQTTSDSNGEFTGFDFASGSTENASRNSWLGGITGYKYPFKGEGFIASSGKAFDKRFIYSAKQRKFGVLMSSDGVTIKNDANTLLFVDDDVSDNFYAFEKSYSGVISEEMLKMFASLVEFNDLIGSPIDGYKKSYKELEKLSRLFFEKVESRIEPERFFDFYKWIDNSIMFALAQLFPASAKYSNTSRNLIESHVLERNKYDRKFPLLVDVTATEGYAKGIHELLYNWRFGHAPFKPGMSLFSGQNFSYLESSTDPNISSTGEKSISFWFKIANVNSLGSQASFVRLGLWGTPVVDISIDFADAVIDIYKLLFYIKNSGGSNIIYNWNFSSGVINDVWCFATLVWDGDFSNYPQLSINGNSLSNPDSQTGAATGTTLASISKINILGTNNSLRDANITEIGVWNKTLSLAQIQEIYNNGNYKNLLNHSQVNYLNNYYDFGRHDQLGPKNSEADLVGTGDLELVSYAHTSPRIVTESPFSFPPYGEQESENCFWQKHRKEREDITDRQTLLDSLNSGNNAKHLAKLKDDGTAYVGSTYALRNFSKLSKFSVQMDKNIHGGTNYSENKDRNKIWDETYIHGPVSKQYPQGIPQNVLTVGLGDGQGTDDFVNCVDEEYPATKKKWNFKTLSGRKTQTDSNGINTARDGFEYESARKGTHVWPHNLISGSVTTGYNAEVNTKFKSGVIVTNVHSDTYAPGNDIGMQGPFTETWVGGHQSRHVNLNKFDSTKTTTNNLDDQYSREEGWRLLLKECPDTDPYYDGVISGSNDGAMGLVGPDYGGPYPDTSRKYATRYREERVKRPINVKNIRTTTSSVRAGNFKENYEVINTGGRREHFRASAWPTGSDGDLTSSVMSSFYDNHTKITQEASLVGVVPSGYGNVVMNFNNTNRIPTAIKDQQVYDPNLRTKSIIASRFSAPGGFETMSEVYLDVPSKEYSAYNALPFRNLTVRGSGSGELSTSVSEARSEEGYGIKYAIGTRPPNKGSILSGSTIAQLLGGTNNAFSFSFWAYLPTSLEPEHHGYFFEIKDDDYLPNYPTTAYLKMVGPNDDLEFHVNDGSNYNPRFTYNWDNPFRSNLDEWVHVLLTYNGNAGIDAATLYVNSVSASINSYTPNGSPTGIRAPSNPNSKAAWFNSRTSSAGTFTPYTDNLNGIIMDEMSWWTAELSAADAVTLYNSGRPLDLSVGSYGSLLHYWPISSSNDIIATSVDGQMFLEDVVGSGDITGSKDLDYLNQIEWDTQTYNYTITTQRNSIIRLNDIHGNRFGLQTHLRRHAGQFGYDSAVGSETTENSYVTTPSFHKVNRNRLVHIGNSTLEDYTPATSSQFDNGFVTHQIPRSDYQYSWITSSVGSNAYSRFYGFAPYSGLVSSSAEGYVNAYDYLLSSSIPIYFDACEMTVSRLDTPVSATLYYPYDVTNATASIEIRDPVTNEVVKLTAVIADDFKNDCGYSSLISNFNNAQNYNHTLCNIETNEYTLLGPQGKFSVTFYNDGFDSSTDGFINSSNGFLTGNVELTETFFSYNKPYFFYNADSKDDEFAFSPYFYSYYKENGIPTIQILAYSAYGKNLRLTTADGTEIYNNKAITNDSAFESAIHYTASYEYMYDMTNHHRDNNCPDVPFELIVSGTLIKPMWNNSSATYYQYGIDSDSGRNFFIGSGTINGLAAYSSLTIDSSTYTASINTFETFFSASSPNGTYAGDWTSSITASLQDYEDASGDLKYYIKLSKSNDSTEYGVVDHSIARIGSNGPWTNSDGSNIYPARLLFKENYARFESNNTIYYRKGRSGGSGVTYGQAGAMYFDQGGVNNNSIFTSSNGDFGWGDYELQYSGAWTGGWTTSTEVSCSMFDESYATSLLGINGVDKQVRIYVRLSGAAPAPYDHIIGGSDTYLDIQRVSDRGFGVGYPVTFTGDDGLVVVEDTAASSCAIGT